MIEEWIWSTPSDVVMVAVSGVVIYVAVIGANRLAGLRSFAKLSSFDFAMAVAVGSLVSTALLNADTPLVDAIAGVATIFALKKGVAVLRQSSRVASLVDNTPTVLMQDGEIIPEALRITTVTEDDLRSILRKKNIFDVSTVRAIVLETTGDISVLHHLDEDEEIDPWVMEGLHRPNRNKA